MPGVAQRWGRDVLHCPYCHGWEVRDQVIAVLGTGPGAVHQALLFRQLSEHVTLLRNTAPEPGADQREQLAARGIAVVEGEVATLEVTGDRLTGVRLRSGQVVPCQAVVVQPRFTARAGVLSSLGLEPAALEMGGQVVGSYVPADPAGATTVPGVWVAGQRRRPHGPGHHLRGGRPGHRGGHQRGSDRGGHRRGGGRAPGPPVARGRAVARNAGSPAGHAVARNAGS